MLDDTFSVRLENIVKNNQVTYKAIVISQLGRRVAPTIYLEDYYKDYEAGRNIQDISLAILVHYENCRDDLNVDIDRVLDFEYIKERIYVKVVNTELNAEQLCDIPHMEYYDLSMVIYAEVGETVAHSAIMRVVNKHLEMWNVTKDDIFELAIHNTRKKMVQLRRMSDVVLKLLEGRLKEYNYIVGVDRELDELVEEVRGHIEETRQHEMYVLTNESGYGGAAYIMFDDILDEVSNQIEDDIYILPSSIHELILVPKKEGSCKEELENIVKSVNEGDMDPREILSNRVYLYERGKGIDWK